jgi:hypothetical protein
MQSQTVVDEQFFVFSLAKKQFSRRFKGIINMFDLTFSYDPRQIKDEKKLTSSKLFIT